MIRLFATLAFVLVALCAFNPLEHAAAGKGWCRSDPVIRVDGVEYSVEVRVGFPEDGTGYALLPTRFTFYTAAGEARETVFVDSGFDGLGETVAFATGGTGHENEASVVVRTDRAYPLEVWVDGVRIKTGSTNDVVKYQYR